MSESAMDTVDELSTEYEARVEHEAEEAAMRIKRGQHWLDWLKVGEGLMVGRTHAMRKAGANKPEGANYNRAFSEWMDARPWAKEMNKATRNHAMWCVTNRDELERWRATLAQNVREALNHPSATKRRYEHEHRDVKDAKPKTSGKAAYEESIHKLEDENLELRKAVQKAQRDADNAAPFDLNETKLELIVQIIAQTVSPTRLNLLAKGLTAEAARRKSVKNGKLEKAA